MDVRFKARVYTQCLEGTYLKPHTLIAPFGRPSVLNIPTPKPTMDTLGCGGVTESFWTRVEISSGLEGRVAGFSASRNTLVVPNNTVGSHTFTPKKVPCYNL